MDRRHWLWRDVVFDVVPVMVLLVIGLIDAAAGLSDPYGHGPRWTAFALVIAACLALLFRRHFPLVTIAVMPGAISLFAALTPALLTYWGQFVPWLVAMYSAGRHLTWRRALWAIPISLASYALLLFAYPDMRGPDDVLFNLSILMLLWAIGRLTASWADYRDRTLVLEVERAQAEERMAVLERTRIARELHDVISHTITVIVMQAGGGRIAAATDPYVAVETLGQIERLGQESLTELRTLLNVLRDGAEADGTGADGTDRAPQPRFSEIPALCDRMRVLGLPVKLTTEVPPQTLPPGVQLAAYRVVQEGLTNVLKHAGRVATTVRMGFDSADLTIEVTNAPGSETPRVPGARRGLTGLRERVTALGGVLEAISLPDKGFKLRVTIPTSPSRR